MKRKRKKYRIKKEYIVALCLATLALVLSISISMAAYTNQGFRKGVVTTSESNIRFSSNYLRLYAENSEAAQRENASLSIANRTNIPVQVNNYPSGNLGQYNANVVNYEVKFKIEALNPRFVMKTADYSVSGCTKQNNEDGSIEFTTTGTLRGTRSQSDTYTIEISDESLGNIKIIAEVTPVGADDKIAVGNNILYRVLIPVEEGSTGVTTFDWHGQFFDSTVGQPKDYHAFNYEVSGTVGNGNVTLSWNSSKVTIDPFFLTEMNLTEDVTESVCSITFQVDATEVKNYPIIFYRAAAASDETWEEMNNIVTCNAIASNGEQ